MDYDTMRAFADSWGLLVLFLIFVGVVVSLFVVPGAKKRAKDAAQIPLKDDED